MLLGSGGEVVMTSGGRKVARSDHCSVSGLAASHPSLHQWPPASVCWPRQHGEFPARPELRWSPGCTPLGAVNRWDCDGTWWPDGHNQFDEKEMTHCILCNTLSSSVVTNLFFERIRISNLIHKLEIFRIRILFVVRKFSNPNIRGSGKKIQIWIRIWRNILVIQII